MKESDAALAETVINPAFDRGHYERIEYFSPRGDRAVMKVLPPQEGRYPAWFVDLFPLQAPTAQSLVSAGWRQLGKVQVTAHPRFAYEQLWATARNTFIYLLVIYAAAMLALRVFLRSLLRPLAAVEGAALAISNRDFVTLDIKPSARELARVVEAMNTLSVKVNEAIATERRRAEKLQAAAYRDPVTSLLNGRGFAARFQSIYEGEHEAFVGVLAMVEITDLGAINRALGPERCDELLRGVYRQMQDLAGTASGFAGRWTGALTILALPQFSAKVASEKLSALRERTRVALKEFGVEQPDRIYCAGVEAAPGLRSLFALARSAEEAVLLARESDAGVVVQRGAGVLAQETDPVEAVREALSARRLQLFGQAAYRMSDHRVLHTEILSRLRDAAGNEIGAAQFMPIVAANDLTAELDRVVIERVVAQMKARPEREEAISVNLSIRSIEKEAFADWLLKLLESDRGLASRLVFEVAEHGVVKNEAKAAAFARAISRTGAGFAIDDYGVHRDSLAIVPRLKPAYIKLAGSHTARVATDPGTRFFAESLVGAARQLEIPVIAQMVEDDATFQALGAIGFAGYQGNLMSRPVPWPA
jgi:EAL domain-containing protein (putative c-di-GMP-specific phosphodiesterase class I)/GGDEF domain-containing protein